MNCLADSSEAAAACIAKYTGVANRSRRNDVQTCVQSCFQKIRKTYTWGGHSETRWNDWDRYSVKKISRLALVKEKGLTGLIENGT